jgi:hypothetical protein
MIGELPEGSGTFANITLDEDILPGSLQWDGESLVTPGGPGNTHGEQKIYEIRVSGSSGAVSGPVLLWSGGDRKPGHGTQFWEKGGTIIGPDHTRGGTGLIHFWHYPKGGKPIKTLRAKDAVGFFAIAISVSK